MIGSGLMSVGVVVVCDGRAVMAGADVESLWFGPNVVRGGRRLGLLGSVLPCGKGGKNGVFSCFEGTDDFLGKLGPGRCFACCFKCVLSNSAWVVTSR